MIGSESILCANFQSGCRFQGQYIPHNTNNFSVLGKLRTKSLLNNIMVRNTLLTVYLRTCIHLSNYMYKLNGNMAPKKRQFCSLKRCIRDGPFDIQGGAGIFPRDKLFFSLFFHNKLFFSKVNCNKFFFEKITHLNQKNVNESNTLNEKSSKNLKFLFDH